MTYRSPFITETDEPAFTDCQFASGLMLVAEWTSGEAIHDRHGNTLDTAGLKRLRERIRAISGDTEGGSSPHNAVDVEDEDPCRRYEAVVGAGGRREQTDMSSVTAAVRSGREAAA